MSRAAFRQLPLVAIILGAACLSAAYALQATNWVVMTDELQTSKLATSIAETLSPVPHIHGARYGAPNQLYPLLIAPFFGLLSVPAAVDAAHALNALLLASAAWPAFLLGRAVTRSVAGGYFAATLTAFVPWLALSTTLLTENAAYPAFVWCVFLAHRTIASPSPARDAAALGGLLVAFLARTQLVVLAAVVPVAIVVHELAQAAGAAPPGRRLAALRAGARTAVASHRLLAAAYAAGAVLAAVLLVAGGLRKVFGTYQEAFRGDLLPRGVWRAAVEHLDFVVVAVGIAPFVLGCAWAVATVARPRRREAHAFAVLLLVLVPPLALQVASFNLRFTAGGFIQDRYLFYLAPVLAVASAGALLEREGRGLRAALVVAFGVAFAALAALASFEPGQVIFWASPASAFHDALASAAGWFELSPDSLVRIGAVVVGGVLAAVVWRTPGLAALAATGAAVVVFSVVEVVYVFENVALEITTRDDTIATFQRDWVDAFVPEGTSVALVPYAYLPPDVWWDAEFWNKSVDRTIELYGPTYAPFPVERVSVDLASGDVRGLPDSELLLVALEDTRLRLAGTTTVLTAPPLNLVQAARPYRAEWSTRGADPDGWTRPGRPVGLRFYAAGQPGRREVRVTLKAPSGVSGSLPFTLRSGGTVRRGRLAADKVVTVRVSVCVERGGFGEATLFTPAGVRIPDGRVVGLHLDAIEGRPTGRAC